MTSQMTLDDIARELGVSKSTVSRVISGKGRISDATRERVLAYIQEKHYKPNALAKGLAQKRTYNIGVVCPTDYEIFGLPFFHNCLWGISEGVTKSGYDILILMTDGTGVADLRRVVEHRKMDGVILMRTLLEDPLADYLKKTGMPTVVIGRSPDEELVQVDNDHFTACRELTSILLAKGYGPIGLIGRDEKQVITSTRRQGFEAALKEAGLPSDPDLVSLDCSDFHHTEMAMERFLDKGIRSVICMDEKNTGLVLTVCRQKGIRIPQDLKVASFYYSSYLENTVPAITAIEIDDRMLGRVAARTLLSMLDGEHPGCQFLKNYRILLRESTV